MLEQHSKLHEDLKVFRESIIRHNEKLESKMNKNRTAAQDDLNKAKDELITRLDDIEKFQ